MLASAACQRTKQVLVAEEGIGEEIAFTLMVWRDERLTAICQLDADLLDEHPGERLVRTIEVAAICRRGFDASAFTFVAEGYCASDPKDIDPTAPLSMQFVENEKVRECLTITHVEAGNVYLCAVPYTYEIGRTVKWDTPMVYTDPVGASNQFLASLVEILLKDSLEPFVEEETWRDLVAEDVARWGFHINYGMEDPI